MTATIAKIIWLVFMGAWVVLRQRPGRHSRKTPVSQSRRDIRERLLMAASFTGLGIIPFVYVVAHFPRFAEAFPALHNGSKGDAASPDFIGRSPIPKNYPL